jgi:hypothetical protein
MKQHMNNREKIEAFIKKLDNKTLLLSVNRKNRESLSLKEFRIGRKPRIKECNDIDDVLYWLQGSCEDRGVIEVSLLIKSISLNKEIKSVDKIIEYIKMYIWAYGTEE